MFLATSSSTVGWLLSCAKTSGAMSAAEMKAIRTRKCILILMKNSRQCSDTNVQSRWQSKLYILLGAQRFDRIDKCCTARRQIAGDERDKNEEQREQRIEVRIGWADAVKQTGEQPRASERRRKAERGTDENEQHAFANDEFKNVFALRT